MGRKPKYEKAMSSAEKAREYRQRKKLHGQKQIYFSVSGDMVDRIDELARFFGLPGRAQVVTDLLERPLSEAVSIMREWEQNPDLPNDVSVLQEDDAKKIKEVKQRFWDALCTKVNKSTNKEVDK